MKKRLSAILLAASVLIPILLLADADQPTSGLKSFNHFLTAHHYAGNLSAPGKVRYVEKGTTAAGMFRVTLWMQSEEDAWMRDVEQIKFSTYRCADSSTAPDVFLAQTTAEIQSVFPALTGQRVPRQLLEDLKTLTSEEPKFYSVKGFRNVRMDELPLKCGALDGTSTELDFFH